MRVTCDSQHDIFIPPLVRVHRGTVSGLQRTSESEGDELLSVSHDNRSRLSIFMSAVITQLSDKVLEIFLDCTRTVHVPALSVKSQLGFQESNASQCLGIRHFTSLLNSVTQRQKSSVCFLLFFQKEKKGLETGRHGAPI